MESTSCNCCRSFYVEFYRNLRFWNCWFSHNLTATIFVPQNKETMTISAHQLFENGALFLTKNVILFRLKSVANDHLSESQEFYTRFKYLLER